MVEKKRVVFVCYGLGIGGIEKCLVNLLNIMPEKYDIDILLMNPQYTFKNQVTRKVNFLNIFDYVMNIEDTLAEIKNRGGIVRNIDMFLSYCIFRLQIKFHINAWTMFKKLPDTYDIAIAYSHHDFSPYYVIDKIKAKKKVLWYHNGTYEKTGKRYERDKKYYIAFDKVVAVSTDCEKMLKAKFSFSEGQLIVLKNICDCSNIIRMSEINKLVSFDKKCSHIVTVGRMTAEKGVALAVESCKILCDYGYDLQWHWVGDGNQLDTIQESIEELHIDKNFILEGNQSNPYPFIKHADIYVQPSFYEAYSTTITEAKVLKKPIVTTDVGGMRDQLVHEKNGLIVPIEAAEIANAIKRLLDDENIGKRFQEELEKEDFSPEKSLKEYERTIFS